MKIVGKNLTSEEIIKIATEFSGCYGEYTYSKDLHNALIADGSKYTYDKKLQHHEFCKDIDSENTQYRIYLK